MHLAAYLRSAETILNAYTGNVPFAGWLKEYFRQHKKFGSRDRRMVADLCFCYFRLGGMVAHFTKEDGLLAGQFLCHAESVFIPELKPEWMTRAGRSVEEKVQGLHLNHLLLFPLLSEISSEIDADHFVLSHLVQPDLFLRIRPGKKGSVLKKLETEKISFELDGECLRLGTSTKIDDLLVLDSDVVVQDRSSQRTLDSLQRILLPDRFVCWDCCAASGGKSILLYDQFPKAQLHVSDIRESILHNLRTRFGKAGITTYHSFVADVAQPNFSYPKPLVDVVICDAPCSGSGTWGRTPEALNYFTKEKLDHYVRLQKSIAFTAVKAVKKGGFFLYITCSVYRAENEGMVEHLLQNTSLSLLHQSYQKGYDHKADTLFTALFTVL